MKIRIKGDSLRLRLSRSEVAALTQGERLEETIHFAPEEQASFTYALYADKSVAHTAIQHLSNRVTVLLPANQASVWGRSDQVGIAAEIGLGKFGALALLIEKDFACLDRGEEENQDTFPNPKAGAAC